MSHVDVIEAEIQKIDCLKIAAERLGLYFREQTTHRFFANQNAPCDYAIGDPNNANAYEIGVVKKEGGGYELKADFFADMGGLKKFVGQGAQLLTQRYSVEVARKAALRQGLRIRETVKPDGTIILKASK